MMPVLIVRLIPEQHCAGCGAVGYCCEKTMLCPACLGLKMNVYRRTMHLNETLARVFALRQRELWPHWFEKLWRGR